MRTTVSASTANPRAVFSTPHYHVVVRECDDIWTYERSPNVTRQVRHFADRLYHQGYRPIILACTQTGQCRLYIPDSRGRLLLENIRARLYQERHAP